MCCTSNAALKTSLHQRPHAAPPSAGHSGLPACSRGHVRMQRLPRRVRFRSYSQLGSTRACSVFVRSYRPGPPLPLPPATADRPVARQAPPIVRTEPVAMPHAAIPSEQVARRTRTALIGRRNVDMRSRSNTRASQTSGLDFRGLGGRPQRAGRVRRIGLGAARSVTRCRQLMLEIQPMATNRPNARMAV